MGAAAPPARGFDAMSNILISGILVLCAAAAACAGLITVLRPVLERYALVRPNARSTHKQPTPQGGGIAVVGTTLLLSLIVFAAEPSFGRAALQEFAPVTVAAILLALVGMVDDIRPLGEIPRLVLQFVAVATVIAALPDEARVAPLLPFWIERALLVIAGVWFVNLVNFMDGIDWMTVAEVVPITVYLVVIGFHGGLPAYAIVVAIALCGAMLGFAPFNQPVARLFLGDVGSLPIGLILGWLLLLLAAQGHVAAALLLPLYYLADATVTLIRRWRAGETLWQAHRMHFYQRALDAGFSAREVVGQVFVLNLVLASLATATVLAPSPPVTFGSLVLGTGLVAGLLYRFENGKRTA
jgi:UDP-N-acetylmuramyl pentapeptide phosphotransferase/UDP-N-acetylglucosamine-1-phosphate transferase